jgi:hypothetical protein
VTLAALQAKFQAAILGEDQDVLADINPSKQMTREARFGVYTTAYRLRLAGFLAEDFKVLHSAVGDETFEALAEAYIAATPSQHRNARWYAHDLPDFMQANEPWRDSRILIDLARLERALADAFDAADGTPCSVAALASLSPDQWSEMRLSFDPSVEVLTLAQGSAAAFEAVAAETLCPTPDETQDEAVLVWRHPENGVIYRVLEPAEALAITEAMAEKSFGDICALLQFREDGDAESIAIRAAGYLTQWFAGALITGVRQT